MQNKRFYARGRRGQVYLAQHNGKTVMVKEPNPRAVVRTVENEAAVLREVNRHGIGPRLIEHGPDEIVMEYIEGDEILAWLDRADKDPIVQVLVELLRQCYALDMMGISKKELTRPGKHVIIRGGDPVQLDFDRAVRTDRPKNVTQFCQWLTTRTVRAILRKKDIAVPVTGIRDAARRYKDTYGKEEFDAIVRIVSD